MKFENAKEMYNYLVNGNDLYNKRTGHYVFEYNDAHALCVYVLSEEEMLTATKQAIATGEDRISAILSIGGVIYDDANYSQFRYSENDKEKALYLNPSITYCHDFYDTKDWINVNEFFTLVKIGEVEELCSNTPDGIVIDADTILADTVTQCEYEFVGFAQDIFNIWKNSTDKRAVEQMFYEFTDMEFGDYLDKCRELTSRPDCRFRKE